MKQNKQGFSIIEILIGIVIFTLGLTGVYVLILSTMNLSDYSKNSIIATNLAKESIEHIRNHRDNNYKKFYKWNKIPGNDTNNLFSTGVYYTVENDNSSSLESVKIEEISPFFEGKSHINAMQNYRLCVDVSNNTYTYDCTSGNTKSIFYKYITFSDIKYSSGGINTVLTGGLQLTSKVIWYHRGYHEVELKTILTDYLRQ